MARPLRFKVLLAVALLFVLVTVIPTFVGFLTDWFWFREIGYQSVFTTELATKIGLFVGTGLIAYLFLALNVRLARSGPTRVPVLWRVRPGPPPGANAT